MNNENLLTRFATVLDYKSVSKLDTFVQNYHNSVNPDDYEYMKNSMNIFRFFMLIIKRNIYLLIKNSEIIGYIVFSKIKRKNKKNIYIESIGIIPKYQSRGYGTYLFNNFKNYCNKNSVTTSIELYVDINNKCAINFYNDLEFKETKKKLKIDIKREDDRN